MGKASNKVIIRIDRAGGRVVIRTGKASDLN